MIVDPHVFSCQIYNKDRVWQAPLGAFDGVEGTARFDNISDFKITVKAQHERLGMLLDPGTRLKLILRGEKLIEGPIVAHSGKGPGKSGTFTFHVEDNFRILRNFLIYQVPGGTMAQQANAYRYTITGNAETVFKDLVTKNIIDRSIEPVIVATNQNRGATVTAQARMATLYNEVFPLLESLGFGVTVDATPAGLVVDLYEPGVFPNKLGEKSRIVRAWEYTFKKPEVTHVVVGGQGEGVARTFISATDTAREALWGDRIEVFRDARDASELATYNERAQETLFDGAGSLGIKATLAEAGNFRLGGIGGLHVGQQVTMSVADGMIEVTDLLREIDFRWTASRGLDIRAQVGKSFEPTQEIASAISTLAGSVSKMKASL